MKEEAEQTEQAKGWIMNTLVGFGVPSNWAKVIAGALIGAAVAYMTLTQTGCVLTPTEAQQAQALIDVGSLFLNEQDAAKAQQVGEIIIIEKEGK